MADRRFLEDGGGRAQTLVEAASVLVFVANAVADEASESAGGALAWVNDDRLRAADICGLLACTRVGVTQQEILRVVWYTVDVSPTVRGIAQLNMPFRCLKIIKNKRTLLLRAECHVFFEAFSVLLMLDGVVPLVVGGLHDFTLF